MRTLIDQSVLTPSALNSCTLKVNMNQFLAVRVPGATYAVLLTPTGDLGNSCFLDPNAPQQLVIDHLRQVQNALTLALSLFVLPLAFVLTPALNFSITLSLSSHPHALLSLSWLSLSLPHTCSHFSLTANASLTRTHAHYRLRMLPPECSFMSGFGGACNDSELYFSMHHLAGVYRNEAARSRAHGACRLRG